LICIPVNAPKTPHIAVHFRTLYLASSDSMIDNVLVYKAHGCGMGEKLAEKDFLWR